MATLHLSLDGTMLKGFDTILLKRREVANEAEFRVWQAGYDGWRWQHPLLGQFAPREVKFDLSLPGVIELVIENSRVAMSPLGIDFDNRFLAKVDSKSTSPTFNGIPWLVTRATLVSKFRSAVPLREGFIHNWMNDGRVAVHVICEGEGDLDLKCYEYKIRMETQHSGHTDATNPLYLPVVAGDHYQVLANAIREVVGMVVRIDRGVTSS